MRLHENKQLFADAINAASRPKNEGGLGIKSIFIEKDYWICRSLKLMAEGDKDGKVVFKGGTSLSKAYGIGARFSEDIDVAIAEAWTLTNNNRYDHRGQSFSLRSRKLQNYFVWQMISASFLMP